MVRSSECTSRKERKKEKDFKIKERTEQSEIIKKTSGSCAEAGSFNIIDSKCKKGTDHLMKFYKSLRMKIVERNVCREAWPHKDIIVNDKSHISTCCKIDK